MATKLGHNCKLYYNTGSYASPVWVEVKLVRDVSTPLSATEVDTSTRNSDWKTFAAGMFDLGVEFDIKHDNSNTAYAYLQDAFYARTEFEVAILDAAYTTDGANGLRFTCQIFEWSRGEPLDDMLTTTVKLRPVDATNEPAEFTVAIS